MSAFPLKNPLIVALDVDTAEHAMRLATSLSSRAGAFKIGPRLVVRYGADLIGRLGRLAPVFVDCKYLDIPSTMEGAIRATYEAGATLTTIHAWAGHEALARLAKVEKELVHTGGRPFKILAVTVLTSFTQETMPPVMRQAKIQDHVEDLARLAIENDLTGLVCSPHELSALRGWFPSAYLVSPGVRLPTDAVGDQKRVETPASAIRAGASALVVGRPIIEALDPVEAADHILDSIDQGRK
jgi:orotidine-5'-phosphate decarboxylase